MDLDVKDSTSESSASTDQLLSRIQHYEQKFRKSISALFKNFSEYFQNATTTAFSRAVASAPNSQGQSESHSQLPPVTPGPMATGTPNWSTIQSIYQEKSTTVINSTTGFTESVLLLSPNDDANDNSDFLYNFIGITWNEIAIQLILLFIISCCLWLINRHILKWSSLSTLTEIIISWLIVFLISPLILLFFLPIFITRAFIRIYLKLRHGNVRKIFLANPFDSVWSFEQPHSPSTCVGFYIIEGDGELERIRQLLYTRVMLKESPAGELIYDRFRWRLKTILGFIVWERIEKFDIKNHIKYMADRAQNPIRKDPTKFWTESDVFEELENLHETSLYDLKPCTSPFSSEEKLSPWEILIVPKLTYQNGLPGKSYYGIIFRIHHSLMDGISMGNILHDCLCDNKSFKFSLDPIAPLKISKFTLWFGNIISILSFPRITMKNLFFFEKNAFHGKSLIGPKKFNWSKPLKMDLLKQLKNITKTSIFSILLVCIANSMKKLYEKKGQRVPKLIHACPPIAILPYPNRKPRNRFSIVLYPVLFGRNNNNNNNVTILERLDQIYKESKNLASSPDILANYYAVYILGLLPYGILKLLAPLAHATFTFSNIPGPAESIKVLNGDCLVEIGAWIPIKNRIGIGTALFSYNDRLRVTFIADKAALCDEDDVTFLRDQFENEISELALSLQIKCDNLFVQD